ncbi:MAG: hypothetical protein NVSMB19_09970 [Vulcanimicrobiaceae bacterium]
MILFLHAAPVSLAATQAALERRRSTFAVRHALAPGIVDPRAMFFAHDEIDYARIRGALAGHLRGDETRVVLSCSVYNGFAPRLEAEFGLPVERSDDAGSCAARERGTRVGLAVSYPPSYAVIETYLLALAHEARRDLELVPLLSVNAFAFADDARRYASALLAGVAEAGPLDTIYLAQYSMDPAAPQVAEATTVPVVSALDATLSRLGATP